MVKLAAAVLNVFDNVYTVTVYTCIYCFKYSYILAAYSQKTLSNLFSTEYLRLLGVCL